MHTLEYLLHLLSKRIRRETGNNELADAAQHLSGASHEYDPTHESNNADPLEKMREEWARRYYLPLTGAEREDL